MRLRRASESSPGQAARARLAPVARLFLKLGLIGFGGPAAHIAMMRDEVVRRRRWLDDRRFLDLVGAVNLIPGPSSTELAIHVGLVRAGWRGLVVAGVCFILPATAIVLALAVVYVRYGETATGDAILYGVVPVAIAIVVQAIVGLLRTAVKGPLTAAVGAAVLGLYLLGGSELGLLFGAGILVMLAANARRLAGGAGIAVLPWDLVARSWPAGLVAATAAIGLTGLFLDMLKIGAILYGSGYVLIAFLRADFVGPGLLTDEQLLDAVAVGQATPGPVFTTATFVGYLLHGVPGALVATVAIFLPSFLLVAVTSPLIPRLRASAWFSGFLDGVNVAALALMTGVTIDLGRTALVDVPAALLAAGAALVLLRYRPNAAWVVLAGGLIGVAIQAVD